jgi:hypothetical protein
MMIDVHISDDYLAQLATLIAERLVELQKQEDTTSKPAYPAPSDPATQE